MAELLNISFTFTCRTSHTNKEGKSPIALRISFRGERREIFTGLYCFPKDWDTSSKNLFRSDKEGTEKRAKIFIEELLWCINQLKGIQN